VEALGVHLFKMGGKTMTSSSSSFSSVMRGTGPVGAVLSVLRGEWVSWGGGLTGWWWALLPLLLSLSSPSSYSSPPFSSLL